MREIKFRGKRIDNGEWVVGWYLKAKGHWHKRGIHEDWIICHAMQNGGWFALGSKHAVAPETVGQYTGLKDKNGTEIYEGDIVRWINSDGESVHSVVKFVDGAFRVHNVCFTLWDYLDNDAEVIGTIHDNPDYKVEIVED